MEVNDYIIVSMFLHLVHLVVDMFLVVFGGYYFTRIKNLRKK